MLPAVIQIWYKDNGLSDAVVKLALVLPSALCTGK